MSEQGSEAVNPGQAIYDALRKEAKAAVDTLPETVFDDEFGQTAADRLVASIKHVHELDRSCWSLQCDGPSGGGKWVVLNVANVNGASGNHGGPFGLLVEVSGEMSHETQELFPPIQKEPMVMVNFSSWFFPRGCGRLSGRLRSKTPIAGQCRILPVGGGGGINDGNGIEMTGGSSWLCLQAKTSRRRRMSPANG